MEKFYYDRLMECANKIGSATFHIGKLLEIIENNIDPSELSSYNKADLEIAVAQAKLYLDERDRYLSTAREDLSKTLERLEAREAI
jgi:hypothetical protein